MRGSRKGIPGLLVTSMVLVGAPSVAHADVIVFDHGAAKVQSLSDAIPIVTPADPLEINNVTYGPGTAFASASAADFDFPAFSGAASGVSFTVDLEALAPVTGDFDPATGVMSMDPVSYTTTVTLGPPDNATCTYTAPLSFSTQTTQVIIGDPFDATGPPPTNGAVVATWNKVSADPTPGCGRINGYADLQGAFWLSNGIETPNVVPGPPPCPLKATKGKKPASRTCGTCRGFPKARRLCKCKKGRVLKKGRCVKKKKKKKKRGARRKR